MPTSALGTTAPAAGAPTVSERLFTAPIATVPASAAAAASDSVSQEASADEPLSIFGITPDPAVVTQAVSVSPAAHVADERPRTKSGKAAKSARALKPAKAAKAATAPASRAPRGSAVKSKRVWVSSAAFAPSGTPRRRTKAAASKALSLVAMLFAGAILVGVSVPSNVFVNENSVAIAAIAPEGDLADVGSARTAQSLAVSDDVSGEVTAHDDLKVVSSAEVLALKYAGADYEYIATTGAVRWPFPYEVPITDGFGYRASGFHKGTDFAAASGTPIYAIADGTVDLIQADWSGYGYHAVISHVINGQQVESLYAHMITDSSPLVVGQQISAGDFIGLVGETGIAYGAHLHFEVHLDGVPVDPYAWLTVNAVD
ncbi:M23 family metallopeptidase [Salinibacterium sp. SWN167]|nr:M23 family metallopeptidase [Salinibacterium sp. SWN139]MBH0083843.1 M23 family metallopeptidase [Salinibacterium sp. SWN167]